MFLHEAVPAAVGGDGTPNVGAPRGEAGDRAVAAGTANAVVAGDVKPVIFFGFLSVVLVALIGAIVLYAIGKDSAAQVILPVATGLLGLLTGQYLGEKSTNPSPGS